MAWAVATAFPSFELRARKQLERQAFVCYLPTVAMGQRVSALFPGYLFFEIDANWRRIFSERIFLISNVLMSGEKPIVVADKIINSLKAKEDSNGNVKVDLPTLKSIRFQHGQAIRVKRGTMIGFHGVFDHYFGGERVKVLFEMMGRVACVTMKAEELSDEIRDDSFLSRSKRKRLLNKQRRLTKPVRSNACAVAA